MGEYLQLSNNGDSGPMRARWWQRGWPVTTFRHDGAGHGVIRGTNLCSPTACDPLWPYRSHDDTLVGAGKMESQALGFGNRVGREFGKKIELCIEIGHVDRDGCAIALRVASLELGALTVQPRAGSVSVEAFQAGP